MEYAVEKHPGRSRTPRRYLLPAAAAFGAGTAAANLLDLRPEAILAASAATTALAIAALLARRRAALIAGALALAALAGALNFAGRSAVRPAADAGSLLELAPGGSALAVVSGRLEEITVVPGDSGQPYVRAILDVEELGPAGRSVPASGRLRLTLEGEEKALAPGVRPGSRVRLPALLRAPEASSAPGGMDPRYYLATRGVWTVGTGRAALCEPLGDGGPSPSAALANLRERLAGIVRRELPEREGALLNTLLIGWRGEMDPEEELAFTRTGTGHLLAVSGIHVMLLVGAVWWFLRMLRASPRWSAAALVLFAICYAELAGARAPVVRAALMASIFLGGMVLERSSDGLNSLAAAFLAILALWPRELFSTGFQMSFAAVAFIMLVTPALEEAWRARRGLDPGSLAVEKREAWRARVTRYLRLSLFTSLAATLGTMPLVVACFGLISPWAALVNLAAIPIAGLALALGLVLLAVGSVAPPLAAGPAALVWGALRLLETVVAAAERLPGCSLVADAPPAWALAGFYALAAAILFTLGRRPGRWRGPAVAGTLALSAAVSFAGMFLCAPRPAGLRATVLATRRGGAAMVEEPSGRSACLWAGGGRELADCLRSERLGSFDLVAVSADREGLTSGVGYLVRSGRAGRFALPAGDPAAPPVLEVLRGAPEAERMGPDWTARLGLARLSAIGLPPAAGRPDGAVRPKPMMVLARTGPEGPDAPGAPGRGAVLFADLSHWPTVKRAAAEAAAGRLRADVLVIGFAWKPARESAAFIKATGARVAILGLTPFEAGEPQGRELLRLCRRAGALPLSTAEYGSLRCTIEDGRVAIEHFADGRWRPLGRVKCSSAPAPARR